MAARIKKTTGKVLITPHDLLSEELFDKLESVLRSHLINIDNEIMPGQFPALIFGRHPSGTVTKIYFMEDQP